MSTVYIYMYTLKYATVLYVYSPKGLWYLESRVSALEGRVQDTTMVWGRVGALADQHLRAQGAKGPSQKKFQFHFSIFKNHAMIPNIPKQHPKK